LIRFHTAASAPGGPGPKSLTSPAPGQPGAEGGPTATPKPPPPPAPQACLDLWNALDSHAFQDDGKHFYADHQARKAWVFYVPNNASLCAYIFVVSTSDFEYGLDGEAGALDLSGWQLMDSVFADPYATQRKAVDSANTSLDANGKLAPL
jgi:hypothetical protein